MLIRNKKEWRKPQEEAESPFRRALNSGPDPDTEYELSRLQSRILDLEMELRSLDSDLDMRICSAVARSYR